jgi:hypothetical protein
MQLFNKTSKYITVNVVFYSDILINDIADNKFS